MLAEGERAPSFSARPIFGRPVEVPGGLVAGPLVLCFVPALGSPFARRTLARLQERYADFDRVGAQVAAVSRTDVASAQDFVPRHHLLFPLIADQDGDLHARYQVPVAEGLAAGLRGVAAALRPSARPLSALPFGIGRVSGPLRQRGAAFVVDGAGLIRMARYANSIADTPDMDALLACASAC